MYTYIATSLKKLKESEIARGIATLSVGNMISQIIPVAMSVILSRLYAPEHFGDFSIFINTAGIITVFVSARYEYAIVRPKREVDALNLMALSGIIALSICAVLALSLLATDWTGLDISGQLPGAYWLPLYILCMAVSQILSNYANRIENYKTFTLSAITRSVTQAISRILFGICHYGTGLIVGAIIGVFSGCAVFTRISVIKPLRRSFSWRRIKELSRTYRNFPLFLMPSGLLNTLSTNLPIILLANFYAKDLIGYFSMAISILYLPISLVGNALGQIFYKKASFWQPERTNRLATRFFTFNAIIGLGVFGILAWGGESLFSFLLGEKWSTVGLYAMYLCPWLITVLCLSPLSWIFDARDQQRTEMLLNIAMFITRVFVILLGGNLHLSFDTTLLLYSVSGLSLWLVEGLFIYRILNFKANKTQKVFLFSYICLILFGWLIYLYGKYQTI